MMHLPSFVSLIISLHFANGLYKVSDTNFKDIVTNICVKTAGSISIPYFAEDGKPENELSKQPYQKCENTTTTNYCFAVWEVSSNDGSTRVLKQGKTFTSARY